ncbi:MAG: type IV pilin [Methanobacteriota archaeon]
MKVILREDKSGVSEVIGTILILAITVVLFSTIILWVSNIPTPSAQTRVDIRSVLNPIYSAGVEIGVDITLFHQGGDALAPVPTILYVTSQRGANPPQTDVVILHPYNGLLAAPSGLLDGSNSVWDIGERWAYKNFQLRSSDEITITIVDVLKSTVVWSGVLNAVPGTRPPVFAEKWTDDIRGTDAIDPVQTNLGFFLYAKVKDPDGDLNPNSVWATLTMWYGTGDACSFPQRMHDDGAFPDAFAGDDIFTLGAITCMSPPFPLLTWDGSIILLNATDMQGHTTTTRLVLKVVEQFSGGGTQTIPSELWQYIGFVQIRTGEIWFSHLSDPVNTNNKFQPFRVTRGDLNGAGGPLFHLQMANHGNRTIFVDGWTQMYFSVTGQAAVTGMYVVDPLDVTRPGNGGGLAAYPGTAASLTDFKYASENIFDIDPLDQETGGRPVVILVASKSAFKGDWPVQNLGQGTYFISILVSGMAGPLNMTYQQIVSQWGPAYNPYDHLNDPNPAFRTQWYAQVIPFIGMTVY